jgi:beta-mannosidase
MTVGVRETVTVEIPAGVASFTDAGSELLTADALGARGVWWFAEPRDSALPAPSLTASVAPAGANAFDVSITADVVVRDLTLLVDKIDAVATVDRGLVTLLPGESATFRITGPAALDEATVLRAEVARSGNQLVVIA